MGHISTEEFEERNRRRCEYCRYSEDVSDEELKKAKTSRSCYPTPKTPFFYMHCQRKEKYVNVVAKVGCRQFEAGKGLNRKGAKGAKVDAKKIST